MYFIGYDIGSSSVKASIIQAESGLCLASAFSPKEEMHMISVQSGWAEQDPEIWWQHLKLATQEILQNAAVPKDEIKAIGISYQMHGLVVVDKNKNVLRPSIIWCDSRATQIGEDAFQTIGQEKCLEHLLNSPGNFTASKLRWIKENEAELYAKIDKIMLPGDYIAMRLTGEVQTTISGLSEGMFWDFKENAIAEFLLDYYGIEKDRIPEIVPTFSVQAQLKKEIAEELGFSENTFVCYRAGDQPNNAFSLNVLKNGEVAANAGTSGVLYALSDKVTYDKLSRVNPFAHVNHDQNNTNLGVLMCINGTGIQNTWMRNIVGNKQFSYEKMNEMAATIPVGSEGLVVLPFGNGAERILQNKQIDSQIIGLNFNKHTQAHLFRAAQEGIVFSFFYGLQIMKEMGMEINTIKAGYTNMFLSDVFAQMLADVCGLPIELYNADGSVGAARAAGIGFGYYTDFQEAFKLLKIIKKIEPLADNQQHIKAYLHWLSKLKLNIVT